MRKAKYLFIATALLPFAGCDFESPDDDLLPPEPPGCVGGIANDPSVSACGPTPDPSPGQPPAVVEIDGVTAVLLADTGELIVPNSPKQSLPYQINGLQSVSTIYVDSIKIGTTGRVIVQGQYGVALRAKKDIDIHGTIDVQAGAATPGRCGAAAGKRGESVELTTRSAGGGGGGAWRTVGGKGGTGVGNRAGGAGGVPLSPPFQLVGGCPGGAGGDTAQANQQGGAGGLGGGAIYMHSESKIEISGQIIASGHGGIGGSSRGGGGGGGSGGMIFLDGRDVSLGATARLCANGGGGGEGGYQPGNGKDGKGDNGNRGPCSNTRTRGGTGSPGANGGPGGARDGVAGMAGDNGTTINGVEGGAGGGGGGVGLIYIRGRNSFVRQPGTLTSPAHHVP